MELSCSIGNLSLNYDLSITSVNSDCGQDFQDNFAQLQILDNLTELN